MSVKGFTLIELVMVLIILGVISAIAVSRFSDSQTFSSRAIANQVLASARLAQQTALSRSANTANVQLLLSQQGDDWRFQVMGGDALDLRIPAANEQIRFGTNMASSCGALTTAPLSLSYDGLGNLTSGQNTRICIADGNQDREICISSAGYAYEGRCVL